MSTIDVAAFASPPVPLPPPRSSRLLGWALVLLVLSAYLAAPTAVLSVLAFTETGAALLFAVVLLVTAPPTLLLTIGNVIVFVRARRMPGRAVPVVALASLACNSCVLALFVAAGGVEFLLR